MQQDEAPTLVSPWYTNGNINSYIQSQKCANRRALARDVVNGLQYLHSIPVAHGDLKGENVLVDAKGRASLCDFGMSQFIDDASRIAGLTTTNAHVGGTDRFMSPELLEDEPKTTATDVWALGCLIFQILTDELPYQHKSRRQAVITSILRGEPPAQSHNGAINETLWVCIKQCWAIAPNDRPMVCDIAPLLEPLQFLPSERILLCILESGLGVKEALALEQTCKKFYAMAQTTQYWLTLAISLSENHPLPMPPFHGSLHEYSRLELKRACLRCLRTARNFWSSSPRVMRRKVLRMSGYYANSSLHKLAFLPGGKYLITISLDGAFACWDYSLIPD
ncbi:hypothetical protein FRC02_011171, partial [Tulasnella sp. 418]